MARLVVALGGNALNRAGGDGSWAEAKAQMRRTADSIAELVRAGHDVVLTHGNGPQVGAMLRQNELAEREVPARPLHVLVAESEGQIGFLVQEELERALGRLRRRPLVVALLGRIEVAARDPAFRHPTKPIGRFYSEAEARILRKREAWVLEFDGSRGGWRRVVPSPRPVRWLEGELVRRLLDARGGPAWLPVVTGGGGIPVVRRRDGSFAGVDAVVDKDRTAALVAAAVGAETLAVVTDVPAVAVGFGRPWERWLGRTTVKELRGWLAGGEFPEGSMRPKIEAGLEFLSAGGKRFVVTDAPSLVRAVNDEAGTRVTSA